MGIQFYMLTNNPGPAIQLLQSFFKRLEESTTPADQDVRFAPGLVALVVSLYRLSGRKAPIKTELGKAASYWRRKSKPSIPLLRAAGTALLESSAPEDLSTAGEIFFSLREQDPNDRTAIAGYVASYATTELVKVIPDLEKLKPVSHLYLPNPRLVRSAAWRLKRRKCYHRRSRRSVSLTCQKTSRRGKRWIRSAGCR